MSKAINHGIAGCPTSERIGSSVRGQAHEALRRQTRHQHDAVESRLILSNLATRAGYIDFLLFNWTSASIEQALEQAGIGRVLPDWARRSRRAALVTDLQALGVTPPRAAALAIAPDIGSLLGWSYVLEGSRLGAKIVLRSVLDSPEVAVLGATAFLRHGEGKRLWQTYRVALGKIDNNPAAIAKACTGGNAAFQCFAICSAGS